MSSACWLVSQSSWRCRWIAHVFFSREGRMKVADTFYSWNRDVADWYGVLSHVKGVPWFWKRRKAILWAGGTERWSTSCVVIVSPVISAWLLRRQQQYSSCCDDSSCPVVVATEVRIRRAVVLASKNQATEYSDLNLINFLLWSTFHSAKLCRQEIWDVEHWSAFCCTAEARTQHQDC